VQWLRDGLGLIAQASETEALASSVSSSEGVVFVPAFNGLGAPYWDPHARGALLGVTRGTRKEHVVRAVLESVAFQTRDVVEAMVADSGFRLAGLRTDGGMVANNFLMQFQADLLGVNVERAAMAESTALGAGCLAGLGAGIFANRDEIRQRRAVDRTFTPGPRHDEAYQLWKRAVERAAKWV
jgi:glycerol kinase